MANTKVAGMPIASPGRPMIPIPPDGASPPAGVVQALVAPDRAADPGPVPGAGVVPNASAVAVARGLREVRDSVGPADAAGWSDPEDGPVPDGDASGGTLNVGARLKVGSADTGTLGTTLSSGCTLGRGGAVGSGGTLGRGGAVGNGPTLSSG
ncbi:MAG: hypothetical protein M3Y88_01505, partial [Chloroflexota bacterium]|nr:hypothetical protein [Chloroflexota bacterium]